MGLMRRSAPTATSKMRFRRTASKPLNIYLVSRADDPSFRKNSRSADAAHGTWHTQESRTHHEIQRPLLTPDECLRMPGPKKDAQGQITEAGDMVIYVAGCPAIYGRQPLFFHDPTFSARAAIPPPAVSDILREPHVPHAVKIE
ncbi:MAG: type IV secretory system conjugative DNA transfer family protein [Nitrospira sp.]